GGQPELGYLVLAFDKIGVALAILITDVLQQILDCPLQCGELLRPADEVYREITGTAEQPGVEVHGFAVRATSADGPYDVVPHLVVAWRLIPPDHRYSWQSFFLAELVALFGTLTNALENLFGIELVGLVVLDVADGVPLDEQEVL